MNITTTTESENPVDRRDFVKFCGATAGAAFLGPVSGCAGFGSGSGGSKYVRFGSTDLEVARLCQGTAFRKVTRDANDAEGQRILHHAIDIGVNFFDSAAAYG